jgi:hypothetical protein
VDGDRLGHDVRDRHAGVEGRDRVLEDHGDPSRRARRSPFPSARTSMPSKRTEPPVGSTSRRIDKPVVLLPHPTPRRVPESPRGRSRSRRRRLHAPSPSDDGAVPSRTPGSGPPGPRPELEGQTSAPIQLLGLEVAGDSMSGDRFPILGTVVGAPLDCVLAAGLEGASSRHACRIGREAGNGVEAVGSVGPGVGRLSNSPRVYGWRRCRYSSSTAASSMIRPP